MGSNEADYRLVVHTSPATIDAQAWNALLSRQLHPLPFMRMEYLRALHDSGSATPESGWSPRLLTLHHDGRMVGGASAYAKNHSYGEYVFDWAWADAYRRHGLRYYPKLVAAVPFTPVPGTRLLADSHDHRRRLVRALQELAITSEWSSAHALFLDEQDLAAFMEEGWMIREGVQFHWTRNDDTREATGLAELLQKLQRDKRKKVQQERRRVLEAGVTFTVHEAECIDPTLWDFFYRCYTLTYAAHHSTPYLTRSFFEQTSRSMPENWVMFVAHRHGQPMACSLIAVDRRRRVAWGRYWGATHHVPCLHFEACYYQPLQWCLERGFDRFEGGAQGEHKMARGLLPAQTRSAHWLRDERFASAVADYLAQETQGIAGYVGELAERNPYKRIQD